MSVKSIRFDHNHQMNKKTTRSGCSYGNSTNSSSDEDDNDNDNNERCNERSMGKQKQNHVDKKRQALKRDIKDDEQEYRSFNNFDSNDIAMGKTCNNNHSKSSRIRRSRRLQNQPPLTPEEEKEEEENSAEIVDTPEEEEKNGNEISTRNNHRCTIL